MIDAKKIIVALDGMERDRAIAIARSLSGRVWGFKINDLLYSDCDIIPDLKKHGKVFVDVKLHDIPNTVFNSVLRLSRAGVDIITVHALGGEEMMRQAKEGAGETKIIAVTILTSENAGKEDVLQLSQYAVEAGLDGVVCSGWELEAVTKLNGMGSKLKIVPGIRPTWYKKSDDQLRTVTPHEAIKLGADYLVVGRPITMADDPAEALDKLCGE